MSPPPKNWLRNLSRLLVLVALAGQVSAGSVVSAGRVVAGSPAEQLVHATVLCRGRQAADRHTLPHHHAPEQTIVGVLAADCQHAGIDGGVAGVRPPPLLRIGRSRLFAVRAPPSLPRAAPYPTGPPNSV